MIKLSYGSQRQVSFPNFQEYYFALGFLANQRNAEIRWENNEDQGAWGSEGRIHCLVPETRFPQYFRFTAGRGNVYARINCNEYVGTLVNDHNFRYNTRYQNVQEILKTVPEDYRQAFQNGYGSQIPNQPAYQKPANAYPSSGRSSNNSGAVQANRSAAPAVSSTKIQSKPEPIKVQLGEQVEHKVFGLGTIYEIDGDYVRVEFPKEGKKSFVNPQSFLGGFLKKT